MKKVLCSRCHERPAVIFISKIVDGKTVPEGLCLKCAMEMNIGPIKQMMDSMGITEEDVDSICKACSVICRTRFRICRRSKTQTASRSTRRR